MVIYDGRGVVQERLKRRLAGVEIET